MGLWLVSSADAESLCGLDLKLFTQVDPEIALPP